MQRLSRLLVVLSMMVTLALAACTAPAAAPTGEQASGEQAASGVTMSFWTRDSNQEQVRALVDAWNESHENQIEVTVIPAGDYMTKVGASVGAGAPPDLMAVDLIYVPQFAAADQLTDITDFAKALWDNEKILEATLRTCPMKRIGESDEIAGAAVFLASAAAGYMKITNTGTEDDRLLSATATITGNVQLHDMKMEGEVMKMVELTDGIVIPAGQTVELKPKSLHVMFQDIESIPVEGSYFNGTLVFEKAGSGQVEYEMMAPNAGMTP